MQGPEISIIIPTYNRANIISDCLNSIVGQTFRNWECIIVDDHSTDDTLQLINEWISKDPRIRYCVNTRTKGAQGSRNTGIMEAKYSWIAFNDSDDEWMPDKLERQVRELENVGFNPYTFVHANCIAKDHRNNTHVLWQFPIVEGQTPYSLLLKGPSPVFPNILTSKKALEEVGLLDEKVPSYQEWDTSLLLSRICSFVHILDPLFTYHMHNGDSISKNKQRDVAGRHYILIKYKKDIIEHYGNQFFIDALLDNIKRIVGFNEWSFGSKLIKEVQSYIPLKTFLYYSACFRFRLNPDSIKEKRFLSIL